MKGTAGGAKKATIAPSKAPEDRSRKKSPEKSKNKIREVVSEVPADEDDDVAEDDSSASPPAVPLLPAVPAVAIPDLPFRDVLPLAPVARTEPKRLPPEQRGPVYHTQAPVERPTLSKEIAEAIMNTPVEATVGQVLGSSPGVMKEVSKQVTRVRVPVNKPDAIISDDSTARATTTSRVQFAARVETIEENDEEEQIERVAEQFLMNSIRLEDLPLSSYSFLKRSSDDGARNTVIIDDPVLQYLGSLGEGEEPKPLIASGESKPLRAIYPIVNTVDEEECLLDSGSQIISMGRDTAVSLGIHWTPDVTINMQSAQGHIEPTLGLARNVPFKFGSITLLLQVHILKDPPYKILLGRPFDCLTTSVVQNQEDGDAILTLTDPATKTKVMLPTYERGRPPRVIRRGTGQDFQVSMN